MTHVPANTTGTVQASTRNSSTLSDSGQLKLDVVDKIFLLETNVHPFVTMLTQVGKDMSGKSWKGMGMAKAACGNPEFKWLS